VFDPENNSLIRTSKKSDKLKAKSRGENPALDADRPVLKTMTFAEFKNDLLSKDVKGIDKLPEMKFLDMEA